MTFSPPSIIARRCPPVLIYFKLKHTYIGRLSQKKYQREMEERTDPTPSAASACSKSLQYSVTTPPKKNYLGDFNSPATSLRKKEILSARSHQKLPLFNTLKLGHKSKLA